jgi:hypothetical protein
MSKNSIGGIRPSINPISFYGRYTFVARQFNARCLIGGAA